MKAFLLSSVICVLIFNRAFAEDDIQISAENKSNVSVSQKKSIGAGEFICKAWFSTKDNTILLNRLFIYNKNSMQRHRIPYTTTWTIKISHLPRALRAKINDKSIYKIVEHQPILLTSEEIKKISAFKTGG